jgi:hypothetical protein
MCSLLIKSFLPNAYVPERVCDQYTDHKPVKRYPPRKENILLRDSKNTKQRSIIKNQYINM